MRKRKLAALIVLLYTTVVFAFLFLPVLMLVMLSFNSTVTGIFPLKGFTLKWYDQALHNQIIWPALQNSLIVAISTAVVSALLGTPAAFTLTRRSFRFKSLLRGLLVLPMSLPTLLVGISLLSFFATLSVTRSLILPSERFGKASRPTASMMRSYKAWANSGKPIIPGRDGS